MVGNVLRWCWKEQVLEKQCQKRHDFNYDVHAITAIYDRGRILPDKAELYPNKSAGGQERLPPSCILAEMVQSCAVANWERFSMLTFL